MKLNKETASIAQYITKIFQFILNLSLVLLAMILIFLLMKELFVFCRLLLKSDHYDYKTFLGNILIFFLYFEFIAMIVKYFKEEYHFPLRYFIYIGITAMIRQIIVSHDDPVATLLNSLVILVLIIGYFIINLTPRDDF
jgi:protein PsiE